MNLRVSLTKKVTRTTFQSGCFYIGYPTIRRDFLLDDMISALMTYIGNM